LCFTIIDITTPNKHVSFSSHFQVKEGADHTRREEEKGEEWRGKEDMPLVHIHQVIQLAWKTHCT
jgi:hypothetical protein